MIRKSVFAVALLIGFVTTNVTEGQTKHDIRQPAPPAAKEASALYFRLNVDGARLTREGCAEIDKLRIGPPTRVPERIYIIEKVSLSEAVLTAEGAALVDVWYSQLGTLDTASGRFRSPTPGLLIRGDCEVKQVGEDWKVVDTNAVPFVGVAAAERYVKDMLGSSTDPVVQRNVQRTLAALKKLAARRP